jgi:hypothetical protein
MALPIYVASQVPKNKRGMWVLNCRVEGFNKWKNVFLAFETKSSQFQLVLYSLLKQKGDYRV